MTRSLVLIALAAAAFAANTPRNARYRSWTAYSGGPESIRYSELTQLNTRNVGKLALAWKFETGDEFDGSEMQCNPIIVDGVFYATTPQLRIIALDAATGKLIWRFDPHQGKKSTSKYRNRGLTWWGDGKESRLFVGVGQYLYALDARTGKLANSFGKDGKVDLREGLGRDPETLNVGANTPGVIYKDLLILGSIVPEDLPSAPGDVRAYDVRTGAIRWTFRTLPRPGDFGYDTWPKDAWKHTGGMNAWAGLSLDEQRGIVFVPTGSAAFDFYGGDRPGDNLFANCLIALKADTGERLWHFQFVKHDVWDRDLPAPPSLVTVTRNGKKIDAVAQLTKSGHLYVFNRETGESLFPLEWRDVPQEAVEGDVLAKKQVFPLAPPPFSRQELTEDILTRRTPEAHKAVLEKYRQVKNGTYTAPSREGTIIFPGLDGGGEWGGASWDPQTGLLYVNANEMAWLLKLNPRKKAEGLTSARELYEANCAGCHRSDFKGSPPEFPSLHDVRARRDEKGINEIIKRGAGRMPAYAHLSDDARDAIMHYFLEGDDRAVDQSGKAAPRLAKYSLDGYIRFLDPDGYPVVTPPWGTLTAIDVSTGKFRWRIPFGEVPALVAKGMKDTGSENYGGSVVTAGGVLFIGATNIDRKFRAFDKRNGNLLWEYTMVAAGNATPAVYEVNGRQFVAIGAGGGKWGNPSGGTYYAFALPEN